MLTAEEVEKVRLVLRSSGWNDVMRPRLEARIKDATKALVLSASERTRQFDGGDFDTADDVLRAMVRIYEWMIVSWENELKVAEYNQRRDELDRLMLP